jgi:hypothetical protein
MSAEEFTEAYADSLKPHAIPHIYPVFELLEARLGHGYYIGMGAQRRAGGFGPASWVLYSPGGEAHCSGKTIRELMINLILTDC